MAPSTSSRSSRTLPTRKSKAATSSASLSSHAESASEKRRKDDVRAGLESRQGSKSPGTHPGGDVNGEGDGRNNDGEKRTPSPPNACPPNNDKRVVGRDGGNESASMRPAFDLKDVGTVDRPPGQRDASRPGGRAHPRPASQGPRSRTSPPQLHGRRSPSPPSGSVISRRGRSRSPVGLTPHPSSRPGSHQGSRSNSRAGSQGSRAGSQGSGHGVGGRQDGRSGPGAGRDERGADPRDGRASAATVQASGGGKELSEAALAAGEAAAGVVERHMSATNLANMGDRERYHRGDRDRYHQGERYPGHHYPSRQRSPSPVSQRFPSGSMSFEMSPQQNMSFTGGDNGSFDWNAGPQRYGHPDGGHRSGPHGSSRGTAHHPPSHHSPRHHREAYFVSGQHGGPPPPGYHGGARGRTPSPVAHHGQYDPRYHDPNSRYYDPRYKDPGHSGSRHDGRYSAPPPPADGHHDARHYSRHDYPPSYSSYHGHPPGHRSGHRDPADPPSHHSRGEPPSHHLQGRSPSPGQPYPPPDDRYHPSHDPRHDPRHGGRSRHRSSRSSSPGSKSGQQPLYAEHHILSSHSKEQRDHYHGRRSSSHRSPGGGRRGRSSDGPRRGELSPGERREKSADGRTSRSSDSSSKKAGRDGRRSSVFRGSPTPGKDNLPKELMLALEEDDDTPPNSPKDKDGKEGRDGRSGRESPGKRGGSPSRRSRPGGIHRHKSGGSPNSRASPTLRPLPNARNNSLGHNSLGLYPNPSMTVDPSQIDACLQDAMLNVDDYLNSNLSFRKSYDLEQVFSFIKEGPGGVVGGAPAGPNGEVKLGSLSFNLGFSESKSYDDGDHRKRRGSFRDDRDGKPLGDRDIGQDGRDDKHLSEKERLERGRDKHDFLPTIHTLRSQSMGLTPINSFSGDNRNNSGPHAIVPLNSMDGMTLRAFFSSSPTTDVKPPLGPVGPSGASPKSGTPPTRGQYGPISELPMSLANNAPVVHASTPPSYAHPPLERYGPPPPGPGGPPPGPPGGPPRGMAGNYAATTPPHVPGGYRVGPPTAGPPGGVSVGFPNKRIKLSTRHSLHPMVDLSKKSSEADFFVLLKKMKNCFGGFQFKLPEMENATGEEREGAGRAGEDERGVVSLEGDERSPRGPTGIQGPGSRLKGGSIGRGYPPRTGEPNEVQIIIAKRRISSSLCAFGGSLPPRTVSFDSASAPTLSDPNNPGSLTNPSPANPATNPSANAPNKPKAAVLEESPLEKEERMRYEEQLSSRYFMKEHCISWDVELHEVIAPKMGMASKKGSKRAGGGGKGGKAVGGKGGKAVKAEATPKSSRTKHVGHFKNGAAMPKPPPGGANFCAPVTPSTPPATPGNRAKSTSPGVASQASTQDGGGGGKLANGREKGAKIKYRCKLCGQPKQNHTCPYQSSLVRSIGTMVYPAVNAFVSNEPGRLAPALSEMNNFTSLLSQDTSMASHHTGGPPSYGGHHPPPLHPPYHHHSRGGPYNVLTPDTSHWSPNTPGGLSTMSSIDPNSPGAPTPGGGTPGRPGGRKRDQDQMLMSRTMTRTMSNPLSGISGQPPPMPLPPVRPPAAPAGAIPSDVLFRDTMELKREQYRTVRCSAQEATNVATSAGSTSGPHGSANATLGPNAYRYPPIPTPYTQRKELGDTLFALSREVPKLADSCAAILRDARENDLWDQAVAELTTQVLVILKCEDRDYTLEGLRRHLLTLGIAC